MRRDGPRNARFHPGQAVVGGHGYLHEVVSGARALLLGVIQGLKFVGRKAQFWWLLAVLDTPMIADYLAGAAAPWPRREALPLPLAALVQWERWICSGSAPEHEVLIIGSLLLMVWAGFRFADTQRTCPSSLLPDRHVLKENAGEPRCPDLASHLVPLPMVLLDDVQAGVGAMCTSMRFDSQMVDLGGQNLVTDYLVPQMVSYDKCPAMVATPMRFSTAPTSLRRVPQAPKMQDARKSTQQAPQ